MSARVVADVYIQPKHRAPLARPVRVKYLGNPELREQLEARASTIWDKAATVLVDVYAKQIIADGVVVAGYALHEPRAAGEPTEAMPL